MEGRISVNDLDIISTINLMERRQRKYLAILMNDVEDVWLSAGLEKENAAFKQLRKSILDNINELKRAWLRDIFTGDIETSGLI